MTNLEIAQDVDLIIEKRGAEPSSLIMALQDIQVKYRYLPQEAIRHTAKRLGIPESQAYHVATFYKMFSLTPRGEHEIKVCLGTACHLKGGQRLLDRFETELDIKTGNTTEDLQFTLESVNCLGACALAPLVVMDGEYQTVKDSQKYVRKIRKLKKAETKGA